MPFAWFDRLSWSSSGTYQGGAGGKGPKARGGTNHARASESGHDDSHQLYRELGGRVLDYTRQNALWNRPSEQQRERIAEPCVEALIAVDDGARVDERGISSSSQESSLFHFVARDKGVAYSDHDLTSNKASQSSSPRPRPCKDIDCTP